MEISKLKLNPKNPRIIKDNKFEQLCRSIQEFPEMMEKRPIVCVTDVDGKLYPLGGNMRLKAIRELGYKDIPDSWVTIADEWTVEQRNEFVIKDNVGFGEWNWDELTNDWNLDLLSDWGLDIPNWSAGSEFNDMTDEDVDITEEFDPIGSASDLHKVIFIFDNEEQASNFMIERLPEVEYKKTCGPAGAIWQVNNSTTYGRK